MFHKNRSLLLFLLPGLGLLILFNIIPFFGGIWYSVTDGTKANQFVGLTNYESLWQNKMFLLGLKNTMILSVICAPLLWVLSFLFALILQLIKPKGKFFRSVSLMPYLAPSSAMLLIWLVIFDFGGPINRILQAFGIDRVLWLESEALRFPVILMFVWKNLGFCTVIFLAAAFRIFKEVYVIAGSYPDQSVYTLQHYMNNMFSRLDYQMVTAAAYSFALIVMLIFGVLFLLQRRASRDMR